MVVEVLDVTKREHFAYVDFEHFDKLNDQTSVNSVSYAGYYFGRSKNKMRYRKTVMLPKIFSV